MATPISGTVTSYQLTTGAKINMDELIYMLSPMDLPTTLGVDAQGTMVLRTAPVDQKQFYWMDEELLTPRATLAASATTGTTGLTVATGEALRFATGDLLRVVKQDGTNEVARVTGVSNATVTVTRGYASTTATNLATNDLLIGIGTALAEGSDPADFRSRDRDQRSNYTEIFGPYKIAMSRTEQIVTKYGVNSEWAKQTFNRMRELHIHREQSFIYGISNDDTSNKIRTTGGLIHYVTSNVDSTSTSLTVGAISTLQQTCFNAGDVPTVLMCNPASLGDLNDISNTSQLRVINTDSVRGRQRVEIIDTEFGSTTIIRNRWVHPHNAFLLKPEGCIRRVLSPVMYETLAKTGDADNAMLVGEEGYEIKGQQHMARFSKLTSYGVA